MSEANWYLTRRSRTSHVNEVPVAGRLLLKTCGKWGNTASEDKCVCMWWYIRWLLRLVYDPRLRHRSQLGPMKGEPSIGCACTAGNQVFSLRLRVEKRNEFISVRCLLCNIVEQFHWTCGENATDWRICCFDVEQLYQLSINPNTLGLF